MIKLDNKQFDRSKLTKSLADNNVLAPFLDREFETFDEPWTFTYEEKIKDDAWHPSGDCIPSVTSLYEKAKGRTSDPISGSLRKSFMVGHYWHQLIQHIVLHKLKFCEPHAIELVGMRFWGKNTLIEREWWSPTKPKSGDAIVASPYHWTRGAGDIAPLITPRWRGIVDIKTIGGEQFKVCKEHKRVPERFAAKYKCQINIYMDLFDEDQGMILGVNKDSPHDFIEIKFDRDQSLIDAIYEKWMFVGECLDKDQPPTEKDNEKYSLPLR